MQEPAGLIRLGSHHDRSHISSAEQIMPIVRSANSGSHRSAFPQVQKYHGDEDILIKIPILLRSKLFPQNRREDLL